MSPAKGSMLVHCSYTQRQRPHPANKAVAAARRLLWFHEWVLGVGRDAHVDAHMRVSMSGEGSEVSNLR